MALRENSPAFVGLLKGAPGPLFPQALLTQLRHGDHPWTKPGFDDRSIAEVVSDGHLGMRSRSGVPLNGAEAFAAGFSRDRCPYAFGAYPGPYYHLWMAEWSVAQRSALSGGSDAKAGEG